MKKNKKIILIGSIFSLSLIFIFFIALYFIINDFSKKTNKSFNYWPKTVYSALSQPFSPTPFNLLVLGLDQRHDQLEDTQVTDTIILTKVDPASGQIKLVSIPRDLWFYQLNAKVNQIYPLSLQADHSVEFIKQNFSDLTGQNIDQVLIFSTQDLVDLVSIVGGVDLYLDPGFTDQQFPNPDYIADPNSGAPVYITVSFPTGHNHIDADNVTYFVRSRKGADTVQQGGTDLGRIYRQQLLIEALLEKIQDRPQLTYQQAIRLYQFWNHFNLSLTDQYLLQLALYIYQNNIDLKLESKTIPVGLSALDPTGLIYHPNYFVQKQWVFLPKNKDYSSIHQFINQSIN